MRHIIILLGLGCLSTSLLAQPSDFGYRYWGGVISRTSQSQPYTRGYYASQNGAFYSAMFHAGYLIDVWHAPFTKRDMLGVAYEGNFGFGWGGNRVENDADIRFSNALGIGWLTAVPFLASSVGLKVLVPFEFDSRLPVSGLLLKPTLELGGYYVEGGYLISLSTDPNAPQYRVSSAEVSIMRKLDDYFGVGIRCEVRKAESEQVMRVGVMAMF